MTDTPLPAPGPQPLGPAPATNSPTPAGAGRGREPEPEPEPLEPTPTTDRKRDTVPETVTVPVTVTGAVATMPGRRGGTLLVGNPGNVGGPGAAPSELRARLRGSFAERVHVLEAMADNYGPVIGQDGKPTGERAPGLGPTRDRDRIAALELLARYGGIVSHALSADDVRDRLRRTVDAIRRELEPAQAAPLLSELRRIWSA